MAVGLLSVLLILASSVPAFAGPLKVTTTIGMIADIAGRIGGEYVEVTALMGPGVDPHLYKASESDIRKLAGADVILTNGLHLEGKLGEVLERMAKRRPVYPLGERIPGERLRRPPGFEGHPDPHVWFDVSLWMTVAEGIRDALSEADPSHKAEYAANARPLLAEMKELDTWAREQIATIPKDQRVMVTAHDAFGYFGRAYDIEVAAIQGVSTDSEASVRQINNLVDLLVNRKIKAVFVESTVPPRTIQALIEGCKARDHLVKVGGELFSDAMGASGSPEGTYLGMIRHNVTTIAGALR